MEKIVKSKPVLGTGFFYSIEVLVVLVGFAVLQLAFYKFSGLTPSLDFSFEASEIRFRSSSLFFTGIVYLLALISIITLRYEFNFRKFFTGLPGYQFMFESWFASVWVYLLAGAILKLDFSRMYFFLSAGCMLVITLLARFIARKAVVWSRLRGYSRLEILLVTSSENWKSKARKISSNKGLGADPKFVFTGTGLWSLRGNKWSEDSRSVSADILSFIKEGRQVDLVLVEDARLLGETGLRELSALAHKDGIQVLVEPGIGHFSEERVASLTFGTRKLLTIKKPNLNLAQVALKRTIDVVLSAIMLLLLLPLFGLISLIQMSWHGYPVFFKQERIGRNGKKFTLLKFRSMNNGKIENGSQALGPTSGTKKQRIKHSGERVTTFGKFLRRHSLDELPQLINVLLGTMSLVGPRPQVDAEVSQYEGIESTRLSIRPGMTGLWQVSGRSNLEWDESIALDLEYVENWSVSRDLVILVKTVREIFRPTGAK